jgi:hypothetical protein
MRSYRLLHNAKARLAIVSVMMLGLSACASDADLQEAEQNLHAVRAKVAQDEASGDQVQLVTDAKQLADAEFVLKYDRMQWPGDSLGHGGNHTRPH